MSDLLASMKLLCIQMWPQHTESLDDLRLEVALRMLKSPHFNARMNALKEVKTRTLSEYHIQGNLINCLNLISFSLYSGDKAD